MVYVQRKNNSPGANKSSYPSPCAMTTGIFNQKARNTASKREIRLPETTPPNPVLADILNVRGLSEQFVNLVAHIELLIGLEVPSGQLFPDSSENLHGSGVLGFTGLVRNALLGIKDATFEDGRPAMAREIAWLHAMVAVDILNNRLPAFR